MKLVSVAFVLSFFVGCGMPSEQSTDDGSLFGYPPKAGAYPMGPNPAMTPGKTCTHPDSYRYPEHIAYCSRAVDTQLKQWIISEYDRRFGYKIEQMDRQQFKIDHYIPLCMGGGNESSNLWPQYQSIFTITDPIEQQLCEAMAQGKMKQAVAIEKIKRAKNDLTKAAPAILRELQSMK